MGASAVAPSIARSGGHRTLNKLIIGPTWGVDGLAATRFCTSCGAPNSASSAYCARCGRPLAITPTTGPVAPAPYPAYSPPPRPANFASFIGGMFDTWKNNFGAFFLVFLILGLITGGISAGLSYVFFGILATGGFVTVPATTGVSTGNLGLLFLYLVAGIIILVVVTSIVTGAMAEYSVRRFRGEVMTLRQALNRGVDRFVSIFGASLFVVVIVVGIVVLPILVLLPLAIVGAGHAAVGFLLLAFLVAIIVVIYVALGLALFAPAIMIENVSAFGGLSRSWSLMRGHRASLFGALLIVVILAAVVDSAFTIPAGITGSPAVAVVAGAVAGAIVSPWFVVLTAVAYDLLARPYPPIPSGGLPYLAPNLGAGPFGAPPAGAAMAFPPPPPPP